MAITLTLDQADAAPVALDSPLIVPTFSPPAPTPPGFPTNWDVRAVDMSGLEHFAFYATAVVMSIQWNYNAPDVAVVGIPLDHPDLGELAPDLDPPRELQIWRNDSLLFTGKPTTRRADSNARMMVLTCKDPTWYFTKRYIGRAGRPNILVNGDFELATPGPWTEFDPDSTLTTTVDTGRKLLHTQSLKLDCSNPHSGPYAYQRFSITAGTNATRVYLTGWCLLVDFIGPAPYNGGLLLRRLGADGPGQFRYAQIDKDTDRLPIWVRLETMVIVPALHTETLEARLYAIHGIIRWDAVTVTLDEHLGWGEGTDQSVVMNDTIQYLQGKGKFAVLSPEKSDLQIKPVFAPTGVEVQGGLRVSLADHRKGFDGNGAGSGSGFLDHYLNSSSGMDWRFEPVGRILRGHYPQVGVDRTGAGHPVFTFHNDPGALSVPDEQPPRNSGYAMESWTFADSLEGVANQVTMLGGWGGNEFPGDPTREEGGYSNPATLGGLTLEAVESAPQGAPITHLNERAIARGHKLENPIATPTYTMYEPRDSFTDEVIYPLIGVLLPGDKINADVVDGGFTQKRTMRLAQVTLDAQTEKLSVVPNPVVE